MIVSLTVLGSTLSINFTLAGIKQEIASNQFEYHASKGPQICTRVVIDAKHYFGTAVLTSLNFGGKVMMGPATVTQVANL
jgi:hypothetical protein